MNYTIDQIAKRLLSSPIGRKKEQNISILLTDSRRLSEPSKTLFIAIKTDRQDGHQYIGELYKKGVRAFIVHTAFPCDTFPEAVFFPVADPLSALQRLASNWRSRFSIPVVGITGSNGKTIVKEWLFQLLKPDCHLIRSPKSFNSQTGVPLSVVEMNATHELAIFEAGISQPGEMEHLQKIIQPDIGLLTNIGEAHADGFRNKREKLQEKLRLFTSVHTLIFREDQPIIREEIGTFLQNAQKEGKKMKVFSWSTQKNGSASLVVTRIEKEELPTSSTTLTAIHKNKKREITIPFTDDGSIEDAIHCWCMLLYLGISDTKIAHRMQELQPVAMRLEMKPGIQNCVLINDSYNSDFSSIKVALEFLFHQRQKDKHSFILSDVEQSGKEEEKLYQEIAHLLSVKKVTRFIGIGNQLCFYKHLFSAIPNTAFYPTTENFIAAIKHAPQTHFRDEIILIKGARSFAFERINKLLEQKKHQAELIVDLNAVVHNLKTYQSLLKPKVKTMVMVKAFSYGSGSAEIAGLLQYHRVNYLAVANIDEGIHLRKNGITLPILILNPDPFYFEELILWDLEPELYSLSMLETFREQVAISGINRYPVHLHLDTGMHRLGFMEADLPELLSFIGQQQDLKIASIFSHLAASESADMDAFTQQQCRLFEKMSSRIKAILPYPVPRHIANTSGISRHPEAQYDMVRLGIGLYGIDPALRSQLEVVHQLRASISQIKEISKGDTIGYGRAGKATHALRIAIVAIGYADGYLRSLGLGRGQLFIHGKPAPTLGQICMDMLMIDITDIPEAKEGDYVTLFGKEPRIEDLAQRGDTIPYEILSGLSQRIIRVYTQE